MSSGTNNNDGVVAVPNEAKVDALANVVNQLKEYIPEEVISDYKAVQDIIKAEAKITDLYPAVLMETTLGQSLFQERCFVFGERLTPHKRLRQCMLQLQEKLSSLYSAKSGEKKARLAVAKAELRVEYAKQQYEKRVEQYGKDSYEAKMQAIKVAELQVKLEETKRGVSSATHLVKDAMQKVVLYKNMTDKYLDEVKETGMSFDEAEFEFFIMYFTRDIETQLKCTGHIDPGTYQSISHLPFNLRRKMFENIKFIEQKLSEAGDRYIGDGDYIYLKYWDILKPQKTGEGEIEGIKVEEFLTMGLVNLLSNPALTSDNAANNTQKAITD